jgi:hypothetical protein
LAGDAFRELLYFGGGETFASNSMKTLQSCHLIKPEDLSWQSSNHEQHEEQ